MRWLYDPSRPQQTLSVKLLSINWPLVALITTVACIGFALLYSAGNGNWYPWASRQAVRFLVAVLVMLAVAVVDIRLWLRVAYGFYAVTILLLIAVELRGAIGMGAQRWIDLGVIQIQPSEFMKIALVMVLARYFNGLPSEDIGKPWKLVVPALLILAPAAMVLKQPDLGTATMLVISGAAMFFLAGVRLWTFGVVLAAAAAVVPFAWHHLRDYQKKRILTFLNPESDPLGAGYHSLQAKIAVGSGGISGKGFLSGTQAHLSFLPERQTDFIFTILGEEFGMVGGLMLLVLYAVVFVYGYAIAFRSRSHFGRLLAFGITTNLFLYVFINVAMVIGLLPVVGVPLPLVSYGGTSMLTVMFGFGLLMSVYVHRDVRISRHGEAES
ncbi:MAG: rod shape-determining protein RodA [Alphaproteobacteria bacterium]|nr:rod shape-determining protein RodA [Alphaproteobacteria bacterium]